MMGRVNGRGCKRERSFPKVAMCYRPRKGLWLENHGEEITGEALRQAAPILAKAWHFLSVEG
jgi:hypothetical protein